MSKAPMMVTAAAFPSLSASAPPKRSPMDFKKALSTVVPIQPVQMQTPVKTITQPSKIYKLIPVSKIAMHCYDEDTNDYEGEGDDEEVEEADVYEAYVMNPDLPEGGGRGVW